MGAENPGIGADGAADQGQPAPAADHAAPHEPDLFTAAADDAQGYAPPRRSNGNSDRGRKDRGTLSRRPVGKRGPDGRTDTGNGGADLERRVARLEFAEGALVRLRVPVHVDAEAGRDVLTDLDVLSLDFDSRLRLSRSTLECKSGGGQSGEGETLLWLAGLQKLLGIERAVLVRRTITRRGQALAAALGLQILNVPTLAEREAAQAWVPDRFAHIDGPGCVAAEARVDLQIKALGHIPSELVAFLRHQSLLQPSHRNLAALVALRGSVEAGGVLPTPTRPVLAGHALQTLALATLQDATLLDVQPVTQVRRRIELALTVGSPDDDHVLAVLGRADQLVRRLIEGIHRVYVDAGASRVDQPAPSLRELVADPPAWVSRYIDLAQRMRANPAVARQLPQTIELGCFDALLGDTAYQAPAFGHLFTAEHRSLLLACIRLLEDIVGTQMAEAVTPIIELDFGRAAPSLPDRTAHASSASEDPVPGARVVR